MYLLVAVVAVVVMEVVAAVVEVAAVVGTQDCWYLVVLQVVPATGPEITPALIWHC